MFTQCPHCMTLFRIHSAQLKIAAGRVRCCQCHEIFNALDSLQESPAGRTNPEQLLQDSGEQAAGWTPLSDADSLSSDTLNLEWDHLYDASKMTADLEDSDLRPLLEQNDGLEIEPDYLTSGGESQISSLLDNDSSPLISLVEAPKSETAGDQQAATGDRPPPPAEPAPEPVKDTADYPGLALPQMPWAERPHPHLSSFTAKLKDEAELAGQTAAAGTYTIDQMFEKEPLNYASIAWGVGSLLLACMLILQLAWHYREQVIHKEIGRQLLTQMCSILDCTVPLRRDTGKFIVEYRDLRAHPDKSDALQLQLHMANRASFDQPYPKLHLSLFNDEEKLIAERTFVPAEYLPEGSSGDGLMRSSQYLRINLELQDPGKEVTGFKFEFL